jgi:hypothetical protein
LCFNGVSSIFSAADEEASKLAARQTKQLKMFWRDVPLLLQMAPQSSKLQDVARLDYTVKDSIIPETLEDNDAKVLKIKKIEMIYAFSYIC